MTDTQSTTVRSTSVTAAVIRAYGAILISIWVSLNFLGLVIAVFFVKEGQLHDTLMTVLVQTAAVNFTTVVGYFVGSSASSAEKSEKLEQQQIPPR